MLLLMVGFVGFNGSGALFSAPTLAWFGVCVLVCTTGYSIVLIYYQALGGLWNVPSSERSKVTGVREGFGLLGVLSASLLPSILQLSYSPIHSFSIFSLLLVPMLFLGVWFFLRWYKSRLLGFEAERSQYTKPSATQLIINGRYCLFYGIFFFSNWLVRSPLFWFYFMYEIARRLSSTPVYSLYLLSERSGWAACLAAAFVHTGKAGLAKA